MWRYWAGGLAVAAMLGAALMLMRGEAAPRALLPSAPPAARLAVTGAEDQIAEAAVPEATPATREQKRFNRYDKDRDGKITRDEYLAQRRKAFAKLDRDGDGRLSFDEWAIKATTKFAGADRDRSGAMTPAEFVATAVKRKAPARVKCPPAERRSRAEEATAEET